MAGIIRNFGGQPDIIPADPTAQASPIQKRPVQGPAQFPPPQPPPFGTPPGTAFAPPQGDTFGPGLNGIWYGSSGGTPNFGKPQPAGSVDPKNPYISAESQFGANTARETAAAAAATSAAQAEQTFKASSALSAQGSRQGIAQDTQQQAAEAARQQEAAKATAGLQRYGTEAQTAQQTQAETAAAKMQAAGFGGQQGLAAQQAALTAAGHTSDAALNAAAEQRRLGYMPQIMAGLTGGAPSVNYGGTGALDPTTAQNAAFAREKDRVGQIASSSLASLRDNLGGRGLLGGGIEAGATAGVLGQGQEELGNTVRQQTEDQLAMQQHIRDQQFQGAIAQRGQTLGLAPSLLGLIGAGRPAY